MTRTASIQELQELISRREWGALQARIHRFPSEVVDGAGRLPGIVTADDVLDVVETQVTEDFHRMTHIDDCPKGRDVAPHRP